MSYTVVIPTRAADSNEQLRYAARAWCARVPEVELVTVGHRVPWWSGGHLPTVQTTGHGAQWSHNFPAAMREAANAFAGWFVWSADDIFPMAPQPATSPADWPTWCRTLDLAEYVQRWQRQHPRDSYTRLFVSGMAGQLGIIREVAPHATWNADTHMPHAVTGDRLLELLDLFTSKWPEHPAGHWRAVYGALWPGSQVIRQPDPKAARPNPNFAWLSTSPATWRGAVGARVRLAYQDPCRYEQGSATDSRHR